MRKLLTFSLLLFISIFSAEAVAQTVTQESPSAPSGAIVHYFSTGVMKDSTGDYYSGALNIGQYTPLELKLYPFTVGYSGTSAKGDSVGITIEGRFGSAAGKAAASNWAVLDTVNLTFNNRAGTLNVAKIDLNGYKVEQIRIHVKGFAANRSDAIIRTWLYARRY